MALVRVYCGLASAARGAVSPSGGPWLTAAVVDDAGRLLDLCEVGDDPDGYARLARLVAERCEGEVAVASDDGQYTVVALMAAAGRPLAYAEEDAADDYAERFADDSSAQEIHSPQAARRAVGMARALQSGALSATSQPTPRDLISVKPVLAAHAALVQGRLATASALREVLREVYPAALRAYPDPAEPVALAVLAALPEPGLLGASANGRGLDAVDAVATRLAEEGIADPAEVDQAITALRVAVAETPRRGGVNKSLTPAVAEAVRQAVGAVHACDAACATLVGALAGRMAPVSAPMSPAPPPVGPRRASRRATASPAPALAPEPVAPPSRIPTPPPRRVRPQPAAANGAPPAPPQPMMPPPMAPAPISPPPVAPPPVSPAYMPPAAATAPMPMRTPSPGTPPPRLPHASPPPETGMVPTQRGSAPPLPPGRERPAQPGGRAGTAQPGGRERQDQPSEGFRSSIAAALGGPRPERSPVDSPPPLGFGATDLSIPVPAPRPGADAAPGSRAHWPLNGTSDERVNGYGGDVPVADLPPSELDRPVSPAGRVTPPWQADDLPPEPPTLRLVEPPLVERAAHDRAAHDRAAHDRAAHDRAAHDELTSPDLRLDPPPLRLVEPAEAPSSPVDQEGDNDLLIFAAARSAWFIGHGDSEESEQVEWSSSADVGWRAAEQAARPAVGAETSAGLPRRVPQANLVPGSPLRDERPLRIVRDAATIAAHTTGYFRGWRRGQEIGGYAVGGRPGRESAGGWDFSRDDHDGRDDSRTEYRSAGYRS